MDVLNVRHELDIQGVMTGQWDLRCAPRSRQLKAGPGSRGAGGSTKHVSVTGEEMRASV